MGAAQRGGRQAGREAKHQNHWLLPVIEAQMPIGLPSASSSSDVGAGDLICALGTLQCLTGLSLSGALGRTDGTVSRPQPELPQEDWAISGEC